ncbi:hypothetical protein MASR2M78_32190 [Treponema sp.]
MAIQPIDLQVLFTQLDKIGKQQAVLKEGAQIQQSLQGAADQRKLDDQVRSVNKAQDSGEGAERVKDRSPRHERGYSENEKKEKNEKNDAEEDKSEVVKDPSLGKNIDLSG